MRFYLDLLSQAFFLLFVISYQALQFMTTEIFTSTFRNSKLYSDASSVQIGH